MAVTDQRRRARVKRSIVAFRARLASGIPRLRVDALDEMGRGPREPAPAPPLVTLSEAYGRSGRAPEVLLLGDSTSVLVSPFDLSRRTLAHMTARAVRPWKSCVVAGLAYHPEVYEALVRALTALPARPRVIVLPINVRQFGPEWTGNPHLAHRDLIDAAHAFADDPSRPVVIVPPFPRGSLLRGEPGDAAWEAFLATPVAYPGRSERSVGDFVRVLAERREATDLYTWLRTAFAFHFLFPLANDHERLVSLANVIGMAETIGCTVVAYLVPANHVAGIELLGDAYDDALREKAAIVSDVCRRATNAPGRLILHDWTRLLPPEDFFIRYEVLSHIGDTGRRKLAARVAESVHTARGQR